MAALNANDYSAASADSIASAETKTAAEINTTAKTTAPKTSIGETAARKVLSDWKGKHVVDACNAATQIGLIYAGGVLHSKPGQRHFEIWLRCTIDQARQLVGGQRSVSNGRSAVISTTEIRDRYVPVAANDNTKDDTIDAETLLGMDFAPLEYVIPGYVVEGTDGAGRKAEARQMLVGLRRRHSGCDRWQGHGFG